MLVTKEWIVFLTVAVVINSERLCFDERCFVLPLTPINRTHLAECGCGLLLSGMDHLTNIISFNASTCSVEFSDGLGFKTATASLKGPDYRWPPVVVEDEAIDKGLYGSINVFKDSCDIYPGGNMWIADNRERKFVWDLGTLFNITKVYFRNSRNSGTNDRHVIDFKVSVSRYYGNLVNWIDVLSVQDLPHPLPCDPIRQYEVNATIGRFIKFTSLKSYSVGSAVHYFRVY
ncbi:uncharacterized protein LOC131886693 [Tigriopus californicus]|uniref:uncharacterized protein LOC131886693 n=1 Tax=Tigriopus californicus TaxID=6832 RepID=UPI0027D9E0D9|nr:uncharacterized protein LOC131886693 [Tigriopus californicus]